jgi:zinc resistance-associated protein
MWKALLAATAAVIAGSSLVLSQQMPGLPSVAQAFERDTATASNPDGTDHFGRDGGPRWHPSAEDRSAFTDARIAALKAGLRLTPEQEKNWPTFEAAIRDISKARADRITARANEQPPSDPVERLHRRADALGTVAAGLKKLADAEEPLYKSLDDAQKQRFQILARAIGPHHHMRFAGWQERGWFGHDSRGQDRGPGDRCNRSEQQETPNTNL